jgi:hypothetical protein
VLGEFRALDGRPLLLALVSWAVKLEERLGRILRSLLLLLKSLMRHMVLPFLWYLFPLFFGWLEPEGDGGIVVSHGAIGIYPVVVLASRVVMGGSGQNLLNLHGRPILRHLLPVVLSYQALAIDPTQRQVVTTVGSYDGEAIQVGRLQLGTWEPAVVLLRHLTFVPTFFGACWVAQLRLLLVSIDYSRFWELVGAHARFLGGRDLVILVYQEFQGCQQTFLGLRVLLPDQLNLAIDPLRAGVGSGFLPRRDIFLRARALPLLILSGNKARMRVFLARKSAKPKLAIILIEELHQFGVGQLGFRLNGRVFQLLGTRCDEQGFGLLLSSFPKESLQL